ncbi:hypothetical protein AB6805_07830 [Chitinophaga sp. RCC_12]|uniref:hypothetical protein n=1 Tax=Chitinophaga sp. RCC_12 TaxID=3239226 RepID=UPI0035234A17
MVYFAGRIVQPGACLRVQQNPYLRGTGNESLLQEYIKYGNGHTFFGDGNRMG